MGEKNAVPITSGDVVRDVCSELAKIETSKSGRITDKFLIAAIGAIPWVGSFLAAAASIPGDDKNVRANELRTKWLEEHQRKFGQLQETLDYVQTRFENIGPEIIERIQSPEYLALVRHSFRGWDAAETDEKRKYVGVLITNCAGTRICSDDVIRLFINWLNSYHEIHFAVIKEIFNKSHGVTRYEIWTSLYGETLREDSAEADLYRLLVRDLTTGGVIRQHRETTADGAFLRKKAPRRSGVTSSTMESAFEDTKPYELTELGKKFVHYTMNEVVRRIGNE